MLEIKYANLQPFEDKIEEMINSKDTQLCDFGHECFGLMCKEWWTCNRYICTRGKHGEDK